jgi:hypothetical protein
MNPLFAAIQDHEASLALVRQRNFHGRLPIHEAVEEVLPDVVRYLLKVWPESVKENTDDGRNFIAPPPPSTSPPKGAASAILVVLPFTRRRRPQQQQQQQQQQQRPQQQQQWTAAISATKAKKNGDGGSDPAEADAAMEILRVLIGAWPVSL